MELRQTDRTMDSMAACTGQTVTVIIPSEAGENDVGLTFSGVDIADVTDALTSHLNSSQFPAAEKNMKYVGYPPSTAEQQQFQLETMSVDHQVTGMTEKDFVNWTPKHATDSGGSKLLFCTPSSSYQQSQPLLVTQPRQVKNKMAMSNTQTQSTLGSNAGPLNFPVVMTPVTHTETQRMAIKVPLMSPNSLQFVNVDNPVETQLKSLKNLIFIAQPQKTNPTVAPSMPVYNLKQQPKSYNVVSPVYQSKLEKAVAGPRKMNKASVKNLPKTVSPPEQICKEIVVVSVASETNAIALQLGGAHTAEPHSKQTTIDNTVTDSQRSMLNPRSLVNKAAITFTPQSENNQQNSSTEMLPETVNTLPKSPEMLPQTSNTFPKTPELPPQTLNTQKSRVVSQPSETVKVTSSVVTSNTSPQMDIPVQVKSREYEDTALSRCMLGEMWQLLQVPSTCDAILYTGPMFDTPVKVHKIVLAAISPVIKQQVCNMNDRLLKLKLPADINLLVVNQFVYYIYHARLTITTDNVRDLYRISTIFNMEQLKKYCYDFCKLAGLGHLIINSPDREAITALSVTDQSDLVEPNGTTNEDVGVNADRDMNMDIVQEKAMKKETFAKPSPKKNLKKSAIDWIGSDDMQRSIPIRKRGRTRRGMTTDSKSSINTDNIAECKNSKLSIHTEKIAESKNSKPSINTAKVPESLNEKVICDNLELNTIEMPVKKYFVSTDKPASKNTASVTSLTVTTGSNDNNIKLKTDGEISASLPDPFQSGHFDNSQLSSPSMPLKSVVTRNQLRRKDGQVSELALPDRNATAVSPPGNADKPLKRKGKRSLTAITPSKATDENAKPHSSETNVSPESSAVLPSKKTRLRKSGSEGQETLPMKEVVHMRPPPKKRTKEIHEMMKNEDQIHKEHVPLERSTNVLQKVSIVSEHELPKNEAKPETKRKRNTAVDKEMAQVSTSLYEKSKSMVGIIHFKCLYCGNEFAMGKRAINHVLNTHLVQINEVLEHISVENGTTAPKICDLCGYESKDSNFDYIHMHKYFRHGTPLPKGCTPFTCDLCKKEFFTKFQLRDHKLIHFEDNPFCCEHCGSRFNSRNSLNSHVFHKHKSIRRHKCSQCSKCFKTNTQMLVHFRVHSGERPFKCLDCDYKSTTRGNLRLHLTNRHKMKADVIKKVMSELKPSVLSHEEFENNVQRQRTLAFDKAKKESVATKKQKQRIFDTASSSSANSDILVTVVNQEKAIIENDGNEIMFDSHMMAGFPPEYQDSVTGTNADVVPVQLHKHTQSQLVDELCLPPPCVDDKGDAHRSGEHFIQDNLQYRDIPAGTQVIILDGKQMALMGHDHATDSNVAHYDSLNRDMSQAVFPGQVQLDTDMYALPQDIGVPVPVQHREVSRSEITRSGRRIDPHSREARMLVREVLQEHETKSLLKAAFSDNQIDNHAQNMEQKDLENTVQTNQSLFQEDQSISMETIKAQGHYLTQDGHIISGRRSTMHDVRNENVDTSIERHLMETDDVVQLLPLNYASAPPPLYSATSHRLTNIADTDIQVTAPDTAIMQTVTNEHPPPNNANFQPAPPVSELDPTYVQVNQDTDIQQQYDQNAMFTSYKMYYPQNYQ